MTAVFGIFVSAIGLAVAISKVSYMHMLYIHLDLSLIGIAYEFVIFLYSECRVFGIFVSAIGLAATVSSLMR